MDVKKYFNWKYMDGFILSLTIAYPINIFELPVKCWRIVSIYKFIDEYAVNFSIFLKKCWWTVSAVNLSVIVTTLCIPCEVMAHLCTNVSEYLCHKW